MKALDIFAGPRALQHIRQHGLRAQDVAVVPAAAGGPKGLIFQAMDQWLFGEWLPSAPRERSLIGASIGAWRMAAACQKDPAAAFKRLGDLYCGQRYTAKPDTAEIDRVCRKLLWDFVTGHEADILSHPHYRMHLLANRGRGLLANPVTRSAEIRGFATAAFANLVGRERLAGSIERVVLGDARDPLPWLQSKWDGFSTQFAALNAQNLAPALLASGTLPMIMPPVRGIEGAPEGTYWDGGMIDYHLALPYSRLQDEEIVLYPHFTPYIIPGWLDKVLPWRRAHKGPNRHWLDNVVMVVPSRDFLKTLPRGKLPDRKDFTFYGTDHDARIASWGQAIGEAGRLRDELAAFISKPDAGAIRPM
jgi:hypothetical protein